MIINPEKLAYWYFRLNGCTTIQNFVVHPDRGRDQRTDVDIIAVRFPYRSELLISPMQDDEVFIQEQNRTWIILAEVKTSLCNLNGPWLEPDKKNMQRAVSAIGAVPQDNIEFVAKSVYETGEYKDDNLRLSLFCVGSRENLEIKEKYPGVPQVTWENILSFIYNRFTRYRTQKVSHPQWDEAGHYLWDQAGKSYTEYEFVSRILSETFPSEYLFIDPDRKDLFQLSELIKTRNATELQITSIIQRPAQIGHLGEYIASKIFDIRLESSASRKSIDGYFEQGPLEGRTVNVKRYTLQEGILDISKDTQPDYYLVMTGPVSAVGSSRRKVRPWVIEHVYLFRSADLIQRLKIRGVKIGIATSMSKQFWNEAEIYPENRNKEMVLTEQQRNMLALFHS